MPKTNVQEIRGGRVAPPGFGVHTPWYQARKRRLIDASLPREYFRAGLELGCGLGEFTTLLAGRCDTLVATGCAPAQIPTVARHVRDYPRVRVEAGHLPVDWPAGQFDLITMIDTGSFLDGHQVDEAIRRVEASLTLDGVVVLCHWREAVPGLALDGDAVHSRFLATSGLQTVVEHREESFLLHVLGRGLLPPAG